VFHKKKVSLKRSSKYYFYILPWHFCLIILHNKLPNNYTRTAIKVKCSGNSSTVIGKKKKTNRSSKRKRNCTTEKESVNQSPTCLNINIMKSTENQCATASNNYQVLPTKNAGFCFKLVYVNCSFFLFRWTSSFMFN
jgi:hypothetical protein